MLAQIIRPPKAHIITRSLSSDPALLALLFKQGRHSRFQLNPKTEKSDFGRPPWLTFRRIGSEGIYYVVSGACQALAVTIQYVCEDVNSVRIWVPGSVQRWKKLEAETGSLEKKELHREARKYHPEKTNAILEENPDACLSEIAEKLKGGGIPGIQPALKRMKITRKKRPQSSRNATKKNAGSIKKK